MMEILKSTSNFEILNNSNWKEHAFKNSLSLPKNIENKEPIAGVYVFWWVGSKEDLFKLSTRIKLKGKKQKDGHIFHEINYDISWFPDLNRYALYVGKSTNIYSRFKQHLYRSKLVHTEEEKENFMNRENYVHLFKATTTCQFRSGWQSLVRHLSEEEGQLLLKDNITFSYLPVDMVENRFYLENYLIGALRPWFNLDSER